MKIYEKEFNRLLDTYKGKTDYVAFEKLKLINFFLHNYENMFNKLFLKIVLTFYNVSLEDEDYLEIIERITNQKYTKIINIKTNMTYSYLHTEGRGRDFSYWDVHKRVGLTVAVKDDFEEKDSYSREEILELQSKNELYPLEENSKEYYDADFTKEPYKRIPTLKGSIFEAEQQFDLYNRFSEDYNLNFINVNGEYIDIIVDILRERISINDIFSTMKKYVKNLLDDIYEMYFGDYRDAIPVVNREELETKITEFYNLNFKNVRKLEKSKKTK